MHYIGMDCHITTLDFAVVNDAGRLVKANRVAPRDKSPRGQYPGYSRNSMPPPQGPIL